MDEIVNRISNKELLDRILQALNERERDIVQRHFVLGESINEIADAEHTTVGAVKAIIARIRAKARKIGGHKIILVFCIVSFQQLMRFRK